MAYIIQIILQPIFKLIYKATYRLEIRGQENTRNITKPLLIISNHRSINDPWIIGSSLPMFSHLMPGRYIGGTRFKPPLKWFYDIGIIPFIYWLFGSASIPREGTLEEKIQPIVDLLKMGETVILFPEGGRKSRFGVVGKFKTGAAEIFLRTGVSILPVGIKKLNEHSRTLRVTFGKSFVPLSKNADEITSEFHNKVVELV